VTDFAYEAYLIRNDDARKTIKKEFE